MQLRDEDFDNVNAGEARPLLEEGCWPAMWSGREAKTYTWGEKLVFGWEVYTSLDKSRSVRLSRFYNVQRDKAGRFLFGQLHDYRKDWVAANGGKLPLDRSRLPLTIWQQGLFLIEVVTVRHDSKGRPLSPSFYWSKVGRVIGPIDNKERWERLPLELIDR